VQRLARVELEDVPDAEREAQRIRCLLDETVGAQPLVCRA
jgi:hypothetical protein